MAITEVTCEDCVYDSITPRIRLNAPAVRELAADPNPSPATPERDSGQVDVVVQYGQRLLDKDTKQEILAGVVGEQREPWQDEYEERYPDYAEYRNREKENVALARTLSHFTIKYEGRDRQCNNQELSWCCDGGCDVVRERSPTDEFQAARPSGEYQVLRVIAHEKDRGGHGGADTARHREFSIVAIEYIEHGSKHAGVGAEHILVQSHDADHESCEGSSEEFSIRFGR